MPAAWDETRYRSGTPGDYVLLARRSGNCWFVSCLNGQEKARSIPVSFAFLGAGEFSGEFIVDGKTQRKTDQRQFRLTSRDTIDLEMRGRGGFCGRIKPAAH